MHSTSSVYDIFPRRTRIEIELKGSITWLGRNPGVLEGAASTGFCQTLTIDALYRPMNLTMAGVRPDGSIHSISPATVVTWQFPALAKYRFGSRSVKPFIEAGPSFRVSGNLNNAAPSTYGGTAGLGVEAQLGKLRIGPVARYTHWAADPDYAGSRTKRNQVELLVGLSF
jgi:hypothetical protein